MYKSRLLIESRWNNQSKQQRYTKVNISNSCVYYQLIVLIFLSNGKYTETIGSAAAKDQKEKSKLTVTFKQLGGLLSTNGKYWVVDTDYENYSLVYSCSKILGIFKAESAWFLSRTRQLDETKTSLLKSKLGSFSSSLVSKLKTPDQTNC